MVTKQFYDLKVALPNSNHHDVLLHAIEFLKKKIKSKNTCNFA